MPKSSKTLQNFWLHSSVFALEKNLKSVKFSDFLSQKEPLMVTFSETRASTSRKYVAEQGIMMSNLLQTLQSFWSHSSIFALEKYPKNAKFLDFFYL